MILIQDERLAGEEITTTTTHEKNQTKSYKRAKKKNQQLQNIWNM